MRDETIARLAHLCADTPHATGAEGRRNLMLCMTRDLSTRRGEAVRLPAAPEELQAGLQAKA